MLKYTYLPGQDCKGYFSTDYKIRRFKFRLCKSLNVQLIHNVSGQKAAKLIHLLYDGKFQKLIYQASMSNLVLNYC